jgi:hypothetical protein
MKHTTYVCITIAISFYLLGCSSWNTIPGGTFNRLDATSINFINEDFPHGLSELALQSQRPNQKLESTDFLVSTSGGGQRAAAFTMGVLYELERIGEYSTNEKLNDARKEIDYFSSVSGGGWATGAYLTALIEHGKEDSTHFSLNNELMGTIQNRIQSLEMSLTSNCLVDKLDEKVTSIGGRSIKYGDIFTPKGKTPFLPYLFNNATIQSSHAPFVFDDGYFAHYQIESFNYCGNSISVNKTLASTPISVGIATSSSVPGFRFTQAEISLCEGNSELSTSWLCYGDPKYMHLYDGGVYDNLAYKTGIEILEESNSLNKVMLIVDANADTYQPIDSTSRSSEWKMLLDAGIKSSLAVNALTAQRAIHRQSESAGISTIILGFYSASDFIRQSKKIRESTGKDPLEGLDALKKFVEVDSKNDRLLCDYSRDDNIDCKDNQYYRIGLSSETSHKIGDKYYKAIQELGRLVVRLNSDEISEFLLAQ